MQRIDTDPTLILPLSHLCHQQEVRVSILSPQPTVRASWVPRGSILSEEGSRGHHCGCFLLPLGVAVEHGPCPAEPWAAPALLVVRSRGQ